MQLRSGDNLMLFTDGLVETLQPRLTRPSVKSVNRGRTGDSRDGRGDLERLLNQADRKHEVALFRRCELHSCSSLRAVYGSCYPTPRFLLGITAGCLHPFS